MIFFNYANSQCLSNPVLIGNNEPVSGGSIDSLPSPTKYRVGQITQSGTTVTGTGTTFTSADVGSTLIWQDGTMATITAFSSATSITVSNTQTVTVSQNFTVSTGTSYNISSILEEKSRYAAHVFPRMTSSQRTALNSVGGTTQVISNGSLVYDATVGALYSYQAGAWAQLTGTNSSGQLLLGSGTAALPSYSFSADPTSGMWLAQSGHIDFSTNGANQVEITGPSNAVNQLQFVGAPTGVSPDVIANGTISVADPNININLVAQGTGSIAIQGTLNHTGGVEVPGALSLWNTNDTHSVLISSIPDMQASFSEYYVSVVLTQAEVQAAFATPVLLVSALANTSYYVERCYLYNHFATSAFTGSGTAIIQYGNTADGLGTNSLAAVIPNAFIVSTVSEGIQMAPLISALTATTTTNVGLYFSNITAAYGGGSASSTITIVMKILAITTT